MGHFRAIRVTYMGHPRAKYMGQARATVGHLNMPQVNAIMSQRRGTNGTEENGGERFC